MPGFWLQLTFGSRSSVLLSVWTHSFFSKGSSSKCCFCKTMTLYREAAKDVNFNLFFCSSRFKNKLIIWRNPSLTFRQCKLFSAHLKSVFSSVAPVKRHQCRSAVLCIVLSILFISAGDLLQPGLHFNGPCLQPNFTCWWKNVAESYKITRGFMTKRLHNLLRQIVKNNRNLE